jgi:hypothetical protein
VKILWNCERKVLIIKDLGMGAPKGNRNAVKGIRTKTRGYRWRITPENLELVQKIATQEKLSIAEVIEKSLLMVYPEVFDGKF